MPQRKASPTIYTLIALNNLLTETLDNYTDMMANGYDGKLKTYADAVPGSTMKSLTDLVNKNGNKYFTCIVTELSMRDIEEDIFMLNISARHYTGPVQVPITHLVNATGPCPPDHSKRGYGPNNRYEQSVINGYSSSDVANPKDIVSKGLDNAKSLKPQINSIVPSSGSMNMGQVEDIADEITEEKRKAFILAFLSTIFLVIPIIGEVIGAVTELADVGVILGLLGAAGNAATDIYTIVDDPKNAPLVIVDLILSSLALADSATISKAANIRGAMKAEDVAKLGGKIDSRMKTIEKVKGTCYPIPIDA
ncbi:hypothetical protein GE09DRAFT_1284051 [Coniochaeta sp. 2T2.1]|nr:hypothetical protein GE09DRAFT_1284051 [Coniochaeta sp. 2T2.1]